MIEEIITLINNYWRFDDNQRPLSSWHEKQDLLEKISKEYSDQQNSSLIKEVEDWKEKFNAMSGNCDSMGQTNKALCDRLQEQSTEISQLKEREHYFKHTKNELLGSLQKLNEYVVEKESQISQLKEALEKIIQARNIHDEETFLYVFDRDFDSYKAALNTQPKH